MILGSATAKVGSDLLSLCLQMTGTTGCVTLCSMAWKAVLSKFLMPDHDQQAGTWHHHHGMKICTPQQPWHMQPPLINVSPPTMAPV